MQQVLERLSLYGLVGHAPENEACHHRAVRASQGRCVWVIGKVEAVAFGRLRWSVCFSHAALNVTRRLPPDQTLIHRSAWNRNSENFACRLLHRLEEARAAVEVALIEARRAYVSTVRDVD